MAEERYAAIALLDTPAAPRLREPAVLATLREMIVTGAWWDYVDELAHRVGDLLLSWPAEVRPAVLTWTRSDDRWSFAETRQLSPLSRREALKHLV